MEGIPRMYMLSLELKDTADRSEFGPELKRHINQHYMEDGEKYNDEIKQIEQLRMNAINATRDFNGISTLKKYFGQLHNLASRFPMEEGGEAAVYFSWIDTFDEEPFTHADIRFEQACILYNLGALHAVLGAREGRGSEDEMKVACTHFQCAAGIFAYLKENFTSEMSPDLSIELMTIYLQTMLGQAQECLLEKSMQDNRKSSLVARISSQVTDYYQQALRGLEDINITSLLGSRRTKLWKRTLTVKMLHFSSLSYLYMSNQSEEQQKFGERVAYLQAATDKHNEAMKVAKGQHETVVEALNFAKDVVIGKFQSAKKDNDFVYHEKVPDIDSLPEVKGASLVKALAFQPCDEAVVGPDIFRKLVPMKAHEASSMYSEEKAKLLRETTAGIEEKDKELEQYMASLQVDQLKLGEEEPETLPQLLLEVCAAISVKHEPIKTLVTSMQGLSNVVLDVDGSLNEIDAILEEEAEHEKAFQKEFGARAAKNCDDITKDLVKCRELHGKASQSNTELRKAMETHIENIKILASPLEEIQTALPSLKSAESSVDKEAESTLKRLLDKVEEMKNQRKNFEQQLREALQKDDITNDIVTKQQGNLQAFFQKQLDKHSALVTYISQNLSAQDNILRALTDAHAAYADSKKVTSDTMQKREDKIQELVSSFTVYDDLIAKSNKGVDFYKKLEVTVSKLLARTKEFVAASEKERQEKISKMRVPQRPFAAKPTVPATHILPANVPAGPKLSDFWKPKSSPDRRRGGTEASSPGIGAQPGSVPQPGMMTQHGPGSQLGPGVISNQMVHQQQPPQTSGPTQYGSHLVGAPRATPSSVHQAQPSVNPRVTPGAPASLPPHLGGQSVPSKVPPVSQGGQYIPNMVHPQPQSLPPGTGVPGASTQPASLPSVPVSGTLPSSSGPGNPQHVPYSTGQSLHGTQYSQGGPQGFPSSSQMPSQNQRTTIGQPNPANFVQPPSGQGLPTAAAQPPVGGSYQQVSQAPPVSQMTTYNQNQPPSSQAQPVLSQQQAFNRPPASQHQIQNPVSQAQPIVSQGQHMLNQPPQPLPGQHGPPQQQPPYRPQQPPISQQQPPFSQQQPPFSQQQIYNQQKVPGTQPTNQVPPNVSQSQPVVSHHQMYNQPGHPPGSQPTNQNQPARSQPQPIVSQHQTYNQHIQLPGQHSTQPVIQSQHMNQPGNQQPVSQSQQVVSQSQALNQMHTHRPYSPHQQPPSQPQPTSQPQQFTQTPQPKSQAQSVVSQGPPGVSQPQTYNQQTPQTYPTHQQRLPTGGVIRPPGSGTSQINQSPQHQAYPAASTASMGGQWYRAAPPQGYSSMGPSGQLQHPSAHYQQPANVGQSQPAGQRFGSPVHQQHSQHQQPRLSNPVQSQIPPRHPGPVPQTRPVGQGPYQQQYQANPQGYQMPGLNQPGPRLQGPHQFASQQQVPPQQAQQPRPGFSCPPASGYPTPHSVPGGPGQPLMPSGQSANPVKNVNMRLKAEQESLPEPTLQPTKLKKDLLSSSPEDKGPLGQSDIMVPQNINKEPSKESNVTSAVPPQATPPKQTYTTFPQVPTLTSIPSQDVKNLSGSNLAILSQPVLTSGDTGVRVDAVPPHSNLAILSQPVANQSHGQTTMTVAVPKAGASQDNEDPYLDKAVLDRFVDEVERLEKYVDGLHRQMLSGPTVLDGVWKEVNDDQEKETRQFSISVARCYPTKNRHPDIMPYDHNRVVLKTSSDDFINASYIRNLSPSFPLVIATQAPLPATMEAFWQMIYEQQVFLLVMLVSSKSKGTSEFHQYWPTERGQSQRYGAFSVTFQSSKSTEFHVERFLQLTHVPTKQVRTVLHMQFTAWPEFGVPNQASDLLQFVSQIHNYHLEQKRFSLPIVVHCSGGVDRTGTFCTIYSAVQDINSGKGMTDIPNVVKNLRRQRKWMVSEKEQLKFCYEAVLCYAQQVLAKRGIFCKMSGTMSPRPAKNAPSRLNSFDVIMGADSVQSLQHSISKLSVRPPAESQTEATDDVSGAGNAPDLGMSGSNASLDDRSIEGSSLTPESSIGGEIPQDAPHEETPMPPVHKTEPSLVPKSTSVSEMLETNLDSFSHNAQSFLPPDVVESSTIPQPSQGTGESDGVLPSILEDLTPQNFTIKGEEKPKKFSKEEFEKRKNHLGARQEGESDDPFSSLDPLWSMKVQPSSGSH